MHGLRCLATALAMSTAALQPVRAAETTGGALAPMSAFIGNWVGTSTGQAGAGKVARSYRWVMDGRFVHETNTSTYPPQERNKAGEVHEHWGVFSYDKARKSAVLRHFHSESFVNTYRLAGDGTSSAPLVFESEAFENFSNSWKARETYEFLSADELVETFELAPPGKPFQVYSTTRLKRVTP